MTRRAIFFLILIFGFITAIFVISPILRTLNIAPLTLSSQPDFVATPEKAIAPNSSTSDAITVLAVTEKENGVVPSLQARPVDLATPADSSATTLIKTAISSCPVTLPNGKSPAALGAPGSEFNLGNEDGTLFTIPGNNGAVIFARGGPGFILPDGSLAMKWPWWRKVRGELTIEGQRLDAPAPLLRAEITEGYGDIGFRPVSLIFPTQGCWEVTGKVGKARLTFVTLVVKVPFSFIRLNWSPDGIDSWRYDTSHLPDSLREIINYSNGGELILESVAGEQATIGLNPAAVPHKVMVQGHPGICVQGTLINQQWQDNVDAGFLEWTADGSIYRISHKGLGLRCDDLLRMPDQPP